MGSDKLIRLWSRVYAEFLMPSRLSIHRDLLHEVLARGYEICSVASFWDKIKSGQLQPDRKYFVLRHDVDTDVTAARSMWAIEQVLGVTSSYYFRLSTIDIPLMQEIERSGGEASYHFEELAAMAKEMRLKSRADVLPKIPEMRERFKSNLNSLRDRSGLPMKTVASHGDFVNRKLRMPNWEILADELFRQKVGVELEVYDEAFNRHISSRHADAGYHPNLWKPENPLKALESGAAAIHVLVHPGNWRANPKENLVNDINRALEGLRFAVTR